MRDLTKILCSYLPHGLRVLIKDESYDSPDGIDYSIKDISGIYDNTVIDDCGRDYFFNEITLILRPLYQLKEKIKEGGKEFVPIDELRRLSGLEGARVLHSDLSLRWGRTKNQPSIHMELNDWKIILEKLHEWHFDLYGLIESGQAIYEIGLDIKSRR